ncbi:acetylornithine deacetylase [uncultured Polaribacter sp.]|uniref:acetylornithine deacetylase n=1 Tax=uncultured Polaribacter sp. TaxID=174711 RepID=UPI0026309FB0|nr:acetylornithine deacetylase [uncultured Polaribacter sp.]
MTAEKILSELISFAVLGGESNLSIIHWIQNYIESFGVDTVLVPNKIGNKASLHCRFGPAVDGGTILSGHTDVVPVEGQDWETDPFVLTDKNDGKLYGRGSCDMKGYVACCLSLVSKLSKADLKTPIYFAFSYDEEIGCLAAPELIEHLKNYYSEAPKFALIGEPSLMQPIVGHKGICLFRTTVNGSAGHSSGIRKEVSAIHESARLILWLEGKMNALVASGSIDNRFTPPHSSIHIGMIEGGIAPNVIADQASFSWDARVIPKDSLTTILSDFTDFCKEREVILQKVFPNFNIKTESLHPPVPPLDTEENQEIVSLLKKIGPRTTTGTVAYAAEAGQFAAAGIESIICGPGSIDQAHRANEFIEKDELNKCIAMLDKLIIVHSNLN